MGWAAGSWSVSWTLHNTVEWGRRFAGLWLQMWGRVGFWHRSSRWLVCGSGQGDTQVPKLKPIAVWQVQFTACLGAVDTASIDVHHGMVREEGHSGGREGGVVEGGVVARRAIGKGSACSNKVKGQRQKVLSTHQQKKPAAMSSDSPLVHMRSVRESVSSSSVQSGIKPKLNKDNYEMAPPLNADSSSGGGTATVRPVEQSLSQSLVASQHAQTEPPTLQFRYFKAMVYWVPKSVSQFLDHKKDCRIFISTCANCHILNEDLSASLLKFHPVYDPLWDDNPLLSYGAVDGLLPGKTAKEIMVLCDIIIHWAQPHMNLNWETLKEGIQKFKEEKTI
ncbi:hypothetical protein B0H14DRAFT_2620706 [Mycena olivaceomarginata]|nr:hypothetical protein B0H14DRAFT_2620706 [Mycena olivaceomarginata]